MMELGKYNGRIKESTLEGLRNWAENGVPTGSFLRKVLENDLVGAFAAADEDNTKAMKDIIDLVYNELPANCWGSPNKVKAWGEQMFEQRGA